MSELNWDNYGIGHVRHPTAGGGGQEFAPTDVCQFSLWYVVIAHNGNLTTSKVLARELFLR